MSTDTARALRSPPFLAAAGILIASSLALGAVVSALRANLVKLPIEGQRPVRAVTGETEHWVQIGADRLEETAVEGVLGTKNYVTRVYARKDTLKAARPVTLELHLAYYTGMVDTVPHVPERCLVGGGAQIVGAPTQVPIDLSRLITSPDPDVPAGLGEIERARITTPGSQLSAQRVRLPARYRDLKMRVTEFEFPGENIKMFSGYFFVANGGVCSNAEDVRLLAFDLRSDYAYYMKVQVSSTSATSAEELGSMASDLLTELFPEMMLCVPDWVEVQAGRYPPGNPRAVPGGS